MIDRLCVDDVVRRGVLPASLLVAAGGLAACAVLPNGLAPMEPPHATPVATAEPSHSSRPPKTSSDEPLVEKPEIHKYNSQRSPADCVFSRTSFKCTANVAGEFGEMTSGQLIGNVSNPVYHDIGDRFTVKLTEKRGACPIYVVGYSKQADAPAFGSVAVYNTCNQPESNLPLPYAKPV